MLKITENNKEATFGIKKARTCSVTWLRNEVPYFLLHFLHILPSNFLKRYKENDSLFTPPPFSLSLSLSLSLSRGLSLEEID